jgi:hypothetical protein
MEHGEVARDSELMCLLGLLLLAMDLEILCFCFLSASFLGSLFIVICRKGKGSLVISAGM